MSTVALYGDERITITFCFCFLQFGREALTALQKNEPKRLKSLRRAQNRTP
jgi:hypothetical protein